MATISLYADQVNQFPDLLRTITGKISDFKTELENIRNKSLEVDASLCDLNDVIDAVKASTDTQEDKIDTLDKLATDCEDFISLTQETDTDVADLITAGKDEFYDEYYFLKPDSEKSGWEHVKDWFCDVGEWCAEHWKAIVITLVIVVTTVIAVVAVVASGGTALVPMLAALFTTLGMSAGAATTVATVVSLTVAGIAIASSVASGTMNIITVWGGGQSPAFQKWKKIVGVVSLVSNVFYSVGSIYCGVKGITNSSLRKYATNWITNKGGFRSAVWGAKNYEALNFASDSSLFWAGLGKDGANVSSTYAGTTQQTLGPTIQDAGMPLPADNAWNAPSAAMAMNSSGNVESLLGESFANSFANGTAGSLPYGQIWTNTESVLLNINPAVRSITITSMDELGNVVGSNVISKIANVSISNFTFTFDLPNFIESFK